MKLLAKVLILTMLVSCFSIFTAFAAGPSVSSVTLARSAYVAGFETVEGWDGATLTATASFAGGADMAHSIIQWQWSSDNTTFTNIYKATGDKYIVSTLDKLGYIRAMVTPIDAAGNVGTPLASASKNIDKYGVVNSLPITDVALAGRQVPNTAAKDIFNVSGKEFILIDDFLDDNSTFLVMTKYFYPPMAFDPDNTQKFDISSSNENNIGYFLNNTFISSSFTGEKLPQEIISHVNWNHVWASEKGSNPSDCMEDFYFKAGISLISRGEYAKYANKIGWSDGIAAASKCWWLRSARGMANAAGAGLAIVGLTNDSAAGKVVVNNTNMSFAYRPAFYLNKNFFTTVHLDTSKMGASVKAMLFNKYSVSDYNGIYNNNELKDIGYDVVTIPGPSITNVSIEGTAIVGGTLNGRYTYPTDGLPEGITDIAWVRCNTNAESDTGVEIGNQTSLTYQVTQQDIGKYIKLRVKPRDSEGNIGDIVYSPATQIVPVSLGPVDRIKVKDAKTVAKTDAKNIFKVKGSNNEFILLDTMTDANSKFFVLSKDDYGSRGFDTSDSTQKFTMSNSNNIAYWLNNSFLTSGNGGKMFPDGITQYINYENIWTTEAGLPTGDCPSDYTTQAGVALLSQTEFQKYIDKIGIVDNIVVGSGGQSGWWLRTARGSGITELLVLYAAMIDASFGQTLTSKNTTTMYVRPAFYLKSDFFKKVEVDLDSLGDNVKSAIRSTYTKEDLLGLYNEEQLVEKLGYKSDYEIDSVAYRNADDTADVTDLTKASSVNVNVKFTNSKDEAKKVMLIVVLYNQNGDMTNMSLAEKDTVKGVQVDISAPISLQGVTAGYTLEAFIWSDMVNMVSLSQMHKFPN